jgi:hypothetical protein
MAKKRWPGPLEQKGNRARKKFPSRNSKAENTPPDDPRQEGWCDTLAMTAIGSKSVGLRVVRRYWDPSIRSIEQWRYKGGKRKGQLRPPRLFYGGYRTERTDIRRYSDPVLAAYAYHALRERLLGRSLLPFAQDAQGFRSMGWAEFTPQGANSSTGQYFAAVLRSKGVHVHPDPLYPDTAREFWWTDH